MRPVQRFWIGCFFMPFKPLIERFTDKLQLDTQTGCWNWTACVNQKGYGQIGLEGKVIAAHQAAWILFKGDLPAGLEIDHQCRNRRCANPNHLRAATDKEQSNNRNERSVCRNGHRYDETGFYLRIGTALDGSKYEYRDCKACQDAYSKVANHKRTLARREKARLSQSIQS